MIQLINREKVRGIVWEQPEDRDFSYYVVEQKTDKGYVEAARNGETLGTYIRNLSEDTESYNYTYDLDISGLP